MRFFAVYDLVGIAVDNTYPWTDTLFLTQGVSEEGEEAFSRCGQRILVNYEKQLSVSELRFIGNGAYIGENTYADMQYGARIERTQQGFTLTVSQECNEWLVILLQLSLLAAGYTLLHAAALEKDRKTLLLPSWGGVGKTATVMRFVRDHGWKLLGDDLVIIGKGRILPFLKPFVIYPYHKKLFPEIFESGENRTVKNLKLSSWMSRIIPGVKRALRPFPRLLAFLRKHNPQSMRVAPKRIFSNDQLSCGGFPDKMVWLERSCALTVEYRRCALEELASKAVSVTSVELFAAKLEAVYHMCGAGIISFDDVFFRMKSIIESVGKSCECSILLIPTAVSIESVGEIIYSNLIG